MIMDQATQMNVIEGDQVIEKLYATAPDPTFRDSILPRACRAYARGFHVTGGKQLGYRLAKLAVSIKDRIAVRTRFWKSFSVIRWMRVRTSASTFGLPRALWPRAKTPERRKPARY
jgi:hypothetical protein